MAANSGRRPLGPPQQAPQPSPSPHQTTLSFPVVLHFLQREWNKYERDRTWWLAEKTELQARIAFLEGQRMGEANLKRDLMRRIKMLEHALQQERAKSSGKDFKSEMPYRPVENPPKAPASDTGREVREGRQILLQYLSEMQYTDAVIEAQAQRVKGMLDSWSPPVPPRTRGDPRRQSDDGGEDGRWDHEDDDDSSSDDGGYLAVGGQDEEEDDVGDFNVEIPPDTADGPGLEMDEFDPNAAQDIPEELPIINPNATNEAEVIPSEPTGVDDDPFSEADDAELQRRIAQQFGGAGTKMLKRQSRKKNKMKAADIFAGAPEEGSQLASKMGELFDLDVSNSTTNDTKKEADKTEDAKDVRKTWKSKKEFRGHLDGVRCVAFHASDPLLVSAGEDSLVKVWRTEGKKSTDSTPLRTLRGHKAPVYASTFSKSGHLFTAGADTKIISWDLPNVDAEVFTTYSSDSRLCTASGHSDAIWMLDTHAVNDVLVSGGADGGFRFWDISDPSNISMKSHFESPKGAISCGGFSATDSDKLLLGNYSGDVSLIDIETGKTVVDFPDDNNDGKSKVFDLKVHHTMSLAVAAYGDKKIKFFDCTSGKIVHTLVAHQAAVSCIDFDPSGLYIVSVGHDRSIRMWDVASKACVFESTTHRPKFDEAIHGVAFHPKVAKFATAGADAVVKIYN